MNRDESEQRETDAAAAAAGAIGGESGVPEGVKESQRPLMEAGQGESEGFEQAEAQLIENASHGDQHDAGHVIGDASNIDEDDRVATAGEADAELTSESISGAGR